MDWIKDVIAQFLTTASLIIPAWFVLRGKLAELASNQAATQAGVAATQAEVEATKHAAQKTEQSINNRSSPLSDRLDDVHADIRAVAEKLEDHGRDLRGFRKDIGELRGEDRDIRRDLQEHIKQAAPMMPMLEALHSRYAREGGSNETS